MKKMFFLVVGCLCFAALPYACTGNNNNNETTTEKAPGEKVGGETTEEKGAGEGTNTEGTTEAVADAGPDNLPQETGPEVVFEPNPNVGKIRWTVDLPANILSLALSSDEKTIYATSGPSLYALTTEDGTEEWKMSGIGQSLSAPVVDAEKNILVGSVDKSIYAIHPTLKRWAWKFTAKDPADAFPPALGPEGTTFFVAGKTLYGIKKNTALWATQYDMGDEATSGPAVAKDGTVYVCVKDKTLHAVDKDGKQKWKKSVGSEPCPAISIGADGTIYAGGGMLHAFKPDGSTVWSPQSQYGNVTTAIVIHGSSLYFGSFNGKLYKANASDGKKSSGPNWDAGLSITISGSIDYAPTIGASGIIYLGDSRPSLEAYSPFNGKVQWAVGTASRTPFTGHPIISSDGTLYLGTEQGTLFAVWTESPGPANSPWPRGQGNNQSTSTQQ